MASREQHLRPPHPRRPPAHRSVSLRQPTGSVGTDHSGSSSQTNNTVASASSLKPLVGKNSSGASSNADKWFDKSNNHDNHQAHAYGDNSPPFFLNNNSSSDETPMQLRHRQGTMNSIEMRAGMANLGTDGSSTEDYRGVIDDLTVENKKLKRKLRAYEKLQDPHLKDQKMFEVRVHGLPADKKRELENMLRKFATSLAGQSHVPTNLYGQLPGLLPQETGSSSRTSHHTFNDSAYASASASGQGSSQSNSGSNKKQSFNKSRQNIQSYLHDIPEGLLPRTPAVMTEKEKKKLIVRRLEQVFAGKGAAHGASQQPIQQQEVSQIAAKADRTAVRDSGRQASVEGIREARIMPEDCKETNSSDNNNTNVDCDLIAKQDFAVNQSEQRPTRPLDLDLHRAQVPADNFQYIRHLGFSPPGAEAMEEPADGHGWIYLNLLANMAQLHTLSVTSDFVMGALQEHSQRFEISEDCRKVRWKGGKDLTRSNSDEYEGTDPRIGENFSSAYISSDRGSPRKRMRLSEPSHSGSSAQIKARMPNPVDSKLTYTPLFQHRSSEDSLDSTSDDDEMVGSGLPTQHGESSGMTSSDCIAGGPGMKKRNRKQDAAPIIFYNNARFCTDLSGDSKIEEAMLYNPYLYHSCSSQPVGTATPNLIAMVAPSETRGPLDRAKDLPDAMDLDDNPIPLEEEMKFPEPSRMSPQAGQRCRTYELEASGIGGTSPADNFVINVKSLYGPLETTRASKEDRKVVSKGYLGGAIRSIKDLPLGRKARIAYQKEDIATQYTELPPSVLPHASCFMSFDGDTTPGDSEDQTYDELSLAHGSLGDAPYVAPQPIVMDFDSTDDEDGYGDDEDDTQSEGSLDLLATARAFDPEAVRKQEIEFDAELAERLAEEIPAGSSAATAGGGSGFNSPADKRDGHDELVKQARLMRRTSLISKQPSLKRARTEDSMDVHGRGDEE